MGKLTRIEEVTKTKHALIEVELVKIGEMIIMYSLRITVGGKSFSRAHQLGRNDLSPIFSWLAARNILHLFDEVERALLAMNNALRGA